jgi:hypothetical protein
MYWTHRCSIPISKEDGKVRKVLDATLSIRKEFHEATFKGIDKKLE